MAALAVVLVVTVAMSVTSPRERAVVRQLGLWDAWRCLHTATYVYEPRWNWLHGALLAEAPEAGLPDVQNVKVSLHSGEAIARAKGHVYVLQPGQLTVVTDPQGTEPRPLCVTHLGKWQIVGEHALG